MNSRGHSLTHSTDQKAIPLSDPWTLAFARTAEVPTGQALLCPGSPPVQQGGHPAPHTPASPTLAWPLLDGRPSGPPGTSHSGPTDRGRVATRVLSSPLLKCQEDPEAVAHPDSALRDNPRRARWSPQLPLTAHPQLWSGDGHHGFAPKSEKSPEE